MTADLQNLEDRRDRLYQKLPSFGDFRLGIISETYTRSCTRWEECFWKSSSTPMREIIGAHGLPVDKATRPRWWIIGSNRSQPSSVRLASNGPIIIVRNAARD